MKRLATTAFFFAITVLAADLLPQGQSPAQLDAGRITSGEFRPDRFGPVRWLDGRHFATLEPDGQALALVRYDAVTGDRQVLVGAGELVVGGRDRPLVIEGYTFSPDQNKLLLFTDSVRVWRQNTKGEYYVLNLLEDGPPMRLGAGLPKSTLMFCKFSPQSDRVAYVSEHDIYVQDVATGDQVRLTDDGSRTTINGTFDWVYEEEFDCRDGFRWSPDGKSIAYWQLDCTGVGEFLMIDNLSDRYSRVIPVQYPKAGTTNSSCRIGVIPAGGGETVWMQTPGDPRETYLPRMDWHPAGEELMVQWMPRQQGTLRIYGCDAATGELRLVLEEEDAAYVDVREDFQWLQDGAAFFWTSDRSGWRQAYSQPWQGGDATALTPAVHDLMAVDFADVDRGLLFGSMSPDNATQKHLYRFVDGQAIAVGASDAAGGWHDYQISSDGSLAIHTHSAMDQPPVVDLVRLPSHERVRVLVDNKRLREAYAEIDKGKNEFFQVTSDDGVTMDGWVMYPSDFDATKSWPVLFHVYGEPWGQTVKDTWSLGHHLFHRWMTQQGYVVMSIDARGTPAPKGRDWRKALYKKIGVVSSHDWNQGVAELLERHDWMDRERLAIWGWSGGGAMTLNMLFRYPDLFAAGMSVAPVTHIALYDTIYQERYCGDPREVPEVYHECSPVNFAQNLTGNLLLVHGTADDNVHFQNSELLFDRLVAHGKKFEYLAYPGRAHSIYERRGTRKHLYDSLGDFLMRRVAAGPEAAR